jgi:hypothetical protein
VPIAAKFSENFYQKFGHEATGELVEYLNTIDATYRSELERLNDLNWKRVEERIALVETRLGGRTDKLAGRLDQLEIRMEQRIAELKAELLKWMFLFWLGTIGTVLGLQRFGG